MKHLSLILYVVLLFIFACSGTTQQKNIIAEGSDYETVEDSLIVVIQPFDDINDSLTNYVFLKIKEIIPFTELRKPLPLPHSAYYDLRKRFKADSLLNFLGKISKRGEVVIGLTSKDISTSKDEFPDWV